MGGALVVVRDSESGKVPAEGLTSGGTGDTDIIMNYAGPSTFQGEALTKKKGQYEIIIYAYDPQTGNTGVDQVKVTVQ